MKAPTHPKTTLGLFLGGGQLAFAVVRRGDVAPYVVSQGSVPFALDPGRDEPEVIAAKLREILGQQRISVRYCVLALPLCWIVSSRFAAAGVAAESLGESAALELERLCGASVLPDQVVCLPDEADGQVLALTVEPGVARCLAEACRRAGLKLQCFLPAVAGQPWPPTPGTTVDILPLPEQVDALVRYQGKPLVLRQLALHRDSSVQRLDECLAIAMRNLQVTLSGLASTEFGAVKVRVQGSGQLAERLVEQVRGRDGWEGVFGEVAQGTPVVQAAIMAGQHGGLGENGLCVAPPVRERRSQWWATQAGRPLVMGGLAALLAILAFGGAFLARQMEINRLETALAQLADTRQEAETVRKELRLTAPWFRQTPERLAVLLTVAEAFPERGTVWVNDLAMEADGSVSLTGCARDQGSLLQMTEVLGKRTRNLSIVRTRQGTKAGEPTTFSVTFTALPTSYQGGK